MNPPVPADLDLRDYHYMPVDIVRLFGSRFHAQTTNDTAWRAGMTLWLKSFHQVPAASIPDDDLGQALLAEFGRDLKSWRKVKDLALRGWVRCDDGRLYHPVVAEKALEAWIEKIGQRKSSAAGNAKRTGQEFDPEPFDSSAEAAMSLLRTLNPHSRLLARRHSKAPKQPPDEHPVGNPIGIPDTPPPARQVKEREGKGLIDNPLPLSSTIPEKGEGGDFGFDRFWELFPKDGLPSKPRALEAWLELTLAERVQAIAAIPAHRASKPTTHPISPERWLRERRFATHASKPACPVKVTVERMSQQGDAWEQYARATTGKGLPWPNGRWQCDTEWPPPIEEKVDATA